MKSRIQKRNPLLPWHIGLVIILFSVIFVGFRIWAVDCNLPMILELGILAIIPLVYMTLMYLTFVSQE